MSGSVPDVALEGLPGLSDATPESLPESLLGVLCPRMLIGVDEADLLDELEEVLVPEAVDRLENGLEPQADASIPIPVPKLVDASIDHLALPSPPRGLAPGFATRPRKA